MGHKKAFFGVGVKQPQLLICCPQPPLVRYRIESIDHPPAETAAMSGILHASICCHSLLGQPRAHETGDHPYAAQDRAVSHPRADRRTKLSAAIVHTPGHPARRGRRKGGKAMGIGIPTTAAAGRAIRPCHASATVPCASLVRVVAATRQKVTF